jgi:GTP diphosphokinase / guanosine-3',5'-bis(diphosphate) 3'-diphosphatase
MPPTSPLARLLRGLTTVEAAGVKAADEYARMYLAGMRRRSGESYAQHGVEVALTLRELGDHAELLAVAVLNDLPAHPDGGRLLRESPLTPDQKRLVRRMRELRRLRIDSSTADLDAVVTAFMDEPRLLPLRMAHRLNDVRHLQRFPLRVRRDLARETLHMYAAIAGRLGLHAWRREMEEICFPVAHPSQAKALGRRFEERRALDEACLRHAKSFLLRELKRRGIRAAIQTRVKNLYSTFRKMVVKHRSFDELDDRLALRIIVPEVEDCYRALGIVHGRMRPIPGKLKDYIGAPKENGYRSIHTVVFPLPGVTEEPMEIQIRTEAMHEECEYGEANHHAYKSYAYALDVRPARAGLFQNLVSLRASARSPEQFEHALRTYYRGDRVIVFDAEGTMHYVPKPAVAVDFVKLAYPARWQLLKETRINGRIQRPDMPLHDGDTVEARFGRKGKVTA